MRHMQFIHELPTPAFPEFRRKQVNGMTIAINDIQDSAVFMHLVSNFLTGNKTSIILKVGIAKCYYKDQFNKKIGRETAISKMQHKEFYIEKVRSDDKDIRVKLTCYDLDLDLTLKYYKDSKKIRTFLHHKTDLWVL